MYNDVTKEVAKRLRVTEPEPDGYRYITLDGIRPGRMIQEDSGRWNLEYRAGWFPRKGQFGEGQELEMAEMWAVHEVASWFDMEERAYRKQRKQASQ